VCLVQVPQVCLGQRPTRAELGQHLAAAGEQTGEPAFLAAEHLTDPAAFLGLAELRQRLLELIELTRAAGLTVEVEVSGTAPPLPAAVQLAAYRIIRESLTNVARGMTKLGVRDRAQLVVLAYETGLVRPNWLS
jgi:hypothetical protein